MVIEAYFCNNIEGNGYEWFKCSPEFAIDKIIEIINDCNFPSQKLKSHSTHVCTSMYIYKAGSRKFKTLAELSEFIRMKRGSIEYKFKMFNNSFSHKNRIITRTRKPFKTHSKEI